MLSMNGKNYHHILGVSVESDLAEIKRAYRRLAKKYHPDKNRRKNGSKRFAQIVEAYRILSDPLKRESYEQESGNAICDDPRAFLADFWRQIAETGMRRN